MGGAFQGFPAPQCTVVVKKKKIWGTPRKKRQKDAEQKHTHRPAHTSDFRWLIRLLATLKVHGNSVAGG